jgi:hypothetical protein
VTNAGQKGVEVVTIAPPPVEQRVSRGAVFAAEGERRSRYSLPDGLTSTSPVGYRVRVSLTRAEAAAALELLALERPHAFAAPRPIVEQELFEECALGVLLSRQSTNYRGHRQVTLGPRDSRRVAEALRGMAHVDAPVLDGASMTHVVLSRPYRTPFTMLLTFVGHRPLVSLATVPMRAWRKRFQHADDMPTIGYLQHLHVGILADAMERAAVVASGGRRRAQVHMAPFSSARRLAQNRARVAEIEALCGIGVRDRMKGWRVALVAQVGEAIAGEGVDVDAATWRKLGANLVALRSERIQPGVNHDEKAPPQYQRRQDMDVPEALTVMAGRAAYNAFAHWTGCDRERAKDLLLLERIDVLTPGGKERLRAVRRSLDAVTERVVSGIPWWADLPTGRAFSRNAARGRKAFALAGQRVYIGGLARREIEAEGIDWDLAVRAVGAASARGALVAEILGATEVPAGCDLLAGVCMMAGPVNQNDIGKEFYGDRDLLADAFPGRDPTSLLVWTLKAKTVADPIGNEEQLLNAARKGALVDLRPGPHEVVGVRRGGAIVRLRLREGRVNDERAFGDVGNFVTDPAGREVPGNRGSAWPEPWRNEGLWEGEGRA